MAGEGFRQVAPGHFYRNGKKVYGACLPKCVHCSSRFPLWRLPEGHQLPTASMKKQQWVVPSLMTAPDGSVSVRLNVSSMYQTSQIGDEFWCEVAIKDAHNQEPGEVEWVRTHFHVKDQGGQKRGQREVEPLHNTSGAERSASRGMEACERADGSMRINAKGKPRVYGDLHDQYPAMSLIDVAADGGSGSEEAVWTELFTMAERADGSGGIKPLPPDQLAFQLSGPTTAQTTARGKALLAAQSQLKCAAALDTDREGPTQAGTYDDGAWLEAWDEGTGATVESRASAGSFRNEDKAPASQQQLNGFLRSVAADAARFTAIRQAPAGVVRTWGADMVKHLEQLKVDDGNGNFVVADGLASVRSFMPDAKPSKGFALGADFLVPIFYPGTKYKHKGLSDAKMIGGILTGFFKAYIKYFKLSPADLDTAIAKYV